MTLKTAVCLFIKAFSGCNRFVNQLFSKRGSELTCLSLDCGGSELMSTGDFDSSGKGLGMDGTEEEKDSTPFDLEMVTEQRNS